MRKSFFGEARRRELCGSYSRASSHQPSAKTNPGVVDHLETPVAGHRGPVKNDDAYNARMAAMYREVVLKEKPAVAENGFIQLGALKTNGNGTSAPKPEVPEPVAGD